MILPGRCDSRHASPLRPSARPDVNILDAGAQQFGNAPGLGNASARPIGRIAIEYLWDLADPFVLNVAAQITHPLLGLYPGGWRMAVHFQVGP